jgi:hypothetical protein
MLIDVDELIFFTDFNRGEALVDFLVVFLEV